MSASSNHIRKRDKFLGLFRSSGADRKSKSQSGSAKDVEQVWTASTDSTQLHRLSTVSTNVSITGTVTESTASSVKIEHVVANMAVKDPAISVEPSPMQAKPRLDVFKQNINPPSVQVSLPEIRTRIDTTPQLALCMGLLNKDNGTTHQQNDNLEDLQSDTTTQHTWILAVKQDPIEQDHIRWLGVRMVDEFAKDASKDSTEIAEIVLLGPVLDNETYRRLLECTISAFASAIILDVDLLQGVAQLIQSSPPESLLPDDLVKILSILRVRLQGTHQQSSVHPFHLTLAVSRVLDVMADHKVQDLNRVVEHEPLSEVLSGMKDSSDPYLMYQACYAYQALQYIPDDETALQAVLRHSTGVVSGLVKVSAVFKLDVGAVLEGLGNLQEALGGVIGTAVTVYEGVCSLLESGRGVVESMKEGLGSGQKRLWYPAIRAANALAQAGQVKDLNQLIYEAPCRRDPLFQWGICQLLGEIASDSIWDTFTRQQAAELLGELYKDDTEWGQDESVIIWMLNILGQVATVEDEAVRIAAHTLLQELNQEQTAVSSLPYPLRTRLPLPTSSPTLARVQNIPYVEYDLHLLKTRRLKQSIQSVYIPPLAKPSLNAKDEDIFPLMEKVQEFLQSNRQVMLILGDSGAGKSTFNRHLEHRLWTEYKQGGSIPLFINLPAIDRPDQDLVTKQLRIYNFKDDQIQELRLYRQLILICDGYDESQQLVNLHKTNMLNQDGQWNTKMIVCCRTQFLGPTYLDRFRPQPLDRYSSGSQDLFQEAVIAPFSKDQVRNYVEQYSKDPHTILLFDSNQTPWLAQEYMDKLKAIPNIMDLVKNPFLLTLSLKALPGLVASNKELSSIRVTRALLYDMFVDQWLETNKVRLQSNTLTKEELAAFNSLVDDDFITQGVGYLLRLSEAIFKEQNGNPVVQYTHRQDKSSWKAEFFGTDPEAKLLRDSSPLMRTGNQYRFIHRSVLEYLFSRVIYNPIKDDEELDLHAEAVSEVSQLDTNGPLFHRDLLLEPSIINFLCDRVKLNPDFKHQLHAVIDRSKTDDSATTAATNAITILVRAGVPFNGADLRGIKVLGADLSNGQFDSAQFQGANLTNVNLSKCWLRQADMSAVQMEGVRFGELPYLEVDKPVNSCAYSPDGRILAVGLYYGNIHTYDTSTWTRIHCLEGFSYGVTSIAFSSDSQRLVCSCWDYTVRLWDTTSGEELLVMEGHSGIVSSVTISPCGNRIASASEDRTVRLWDMQTGEALSLLEGHTLRALGVKYSPDGRQLVSCSADGTIRFWDAETGEPGIVLRLSFGEVSRIAYSPDGKWLAAGHREGHLQFWNATSLESGTVFSGHTDSIDNITGIAFSPNGQWIASSGYGGTVRLWDSSSGALVTELTGHSNSVNCVAFSQDSRQIASGGSDNGLRLWEVGPNWSSSCPRDGSRVTRLAYSRDGRSIFSYDNGWIFRQWDAATGISTPIYLEMPEQESIMSESSSEMSNQKSTISESFSEMSCQESVMLEGSPKMPKLEKIVSAAFALDGSQIALGYRNGSIRLWNCQTGAAGPFLEWHAVGITRLVYSPCCRWIISVDGNDNARLWDLHDVELQSVIVDVQGDIFVGTAAFSSTGGQFAIGVGHTIRIFDTQSRVCLGWVEVELSSPSLVYSPNDQQIVTGTENSRIFLWDLQSENGIYLVGHEGSVRCVAYSPCGQWIASGGEDKTVAIWRRHLSSEVESWSKVHSICTFFGWVENVTWNPVGPLELATSCRNGSVQVWRMSIDEDGQVVFKMIWGSNLSTLCTEGAIFTTAVGLGPIYQELLTQRGATCPSD